MWPRLITASLGLFLSCTFLQAQSFENAPIMGSQSTEQVIQQPVDDTYRILVIGDALAGGLGAGLSRMAEPETRFEIVNRFQETSGIARPEVYDWAESLLKIMEGKDFKAVVVLLGANDRQPIREGDFRLVFNTPEWTAAYEAKIDQLLDVLNGAGVKVFWVSIPPMGDAKYDADMQILAALQKQEVQSKGQIYVDLRGAFLGPDGNYTDKGLDDTGEVRKLRSRDGVTFFKQGNNRFGQLLLAEIKRVVGAGQIETTPAFTPKVDLPPPSAVAVVPMFGQKNVDGTSVTFQPDEKLISELSRVLAGNIVVPAISRSDIVPGSEAEKLFILGQAQSAPAGRFDDFSYTKPAE
jgi:hypothetical protein